MNRKLNSFKNVKRNNNLLFIYLVPIMFGMGSLKVHRSSISASLITNSLASDFSASGVLVAQATVSANDLNCILPNENVKKLLEYSLKKSCSEFTPQELSELRALNLSGKDRNLEEKLTDEDFKNLTVKDFVFINRGNTEDNSVPDESSSSDGVRVINKNLESLIIETLDLSYNQLDKVPDFVWKLNRLKTLDLRFNNITEIYDPGEIPLDPLSYYIDEFTPNWFRDAEPEKIDSFYELTPPIASFIALEEGVDSEIERPESCSRVPKSNQFKVEFFEIQPIDSDPTVTICEKAIDEEKSKFKEGELQLYAKKDFYPDWEYMEEIFIEGNQLKGNPALFYNLNLKYGMPLEQYLTTPTTWKSIIQGWNFSDLSQEMAQTIQSFTGLTPSLKKENINKYSIWLRIIGQKIKSAIYGDSDSSTEEDAKIISRFLNSMILGKTVHEWRKILDQKVYIYCRDRPFRGLEYGDFIESQIPFSVIPLTVEWFGNLLFRTGISDLASLEETRKNIISVVSVWGDNRAGASRLELFPENSLPEDQSTNFDGRNNTCRDEYYGVTYQFNKNGYLEILDGEKLKHRY